MNTLILSIVVSIIGIGILITACRIDSVGIFIIGAALTVVSVSTAFSMGICLMVYRSIPAQYELQREYYSIVAATDNDIIYHTDIAELNKQLAQIQAERLTWGNWSMYPEEVLDIKPIGIK